MSVREKLQIFSLVIDNNNNMFMCNSSRDLKPENVMANETNTHPMTTLIDLASCQMMDDRGMMPHGQIVTTAP